mgnify:CR=1 FL=1
MPPERDPDLTMARYQVERYLLEPDADAGNETALVGLLRSGLLKRFESSAHAFANTCRKMAVQHRLLLQAMDAGQVITEKDLYKESGGIGDLEEDEFQALLEASEHAEVLELYDTASLRADVENDSLLKVVIQNDASTIQNVLQEKPP